MGAAAPDFGAASNFTVLSAARGGTGAVTCTNSTITGDVGSSGLMSSVTQTSCTIAGTVIAPVSSQALAGFDAAYDQYANVACTGTLNTVYTNTALTLTPGVYCSAAAVTFTDTVLTRRAGGCERHLDLQDRHRPHRRHRRHRRPDRHQPVGGDDQWRGAVQCDLVGRRGSDIDHIRLPGNHPGRRSDHRDRPGRTTTLFNGDALAKAAVTLTDVTVSGCTAKAPVGPGKSRGKCNQGVGNGREGCDPGNSNQSIMSPFAPNSNDEVGGVPGNPGRKGGNKK